LSGYYCIKRFAELNSVVMRKNVKTIEAHCKNCNSIFKKLFDSNRVQCSEQCKIEYRVKNKKLPKVKPIKVCPKCGIEHTKNGTFCSRKCGNSRIRTEEFNQKIREFALSNPKGWAKNPSNFHGSQGNKEKWNKLRQSKICLECKNIFDVAYSQRHRKYCSVDCSNQNKYHINSNRKKTTTYKGYRMDSGAELLFAQHCDLLNIQWHKNTDQYFLFINSDGKQSKYYPDFYLEQYGLWVEIKGRRYIRKDDELRRESVDKPVILIISNQFKNDFEKFKEYIGLSR
jgi:hypothetical protein